MAKRFFPNFLIILGLLILAYPKASVVYHNYKLEQITAEWEKSLALMAEGPQEPEDPWGVFDAQNVAKKAQEGARDLERQAEEERRAKARAEYIQNHMEGILKIEKISLEAPILKGVTAGNLRMSVASMDHTGKMGETGNYVLTGHSNSLNKLSFNRLDELEKGDMIQVSDGKDIYYYKVDEKLYVLPEETWVLEARQDVKEISLITCYPSGVSTHRLVVKGQMLE